MKIVLLNDRIPPERSGGAERVVWLLALELQWRGHEIHIITTTDKAPFAERRSGIMTHHLHANYPKRWQGWLSPYNPQTVGPLRRLLAELRPDVVHVHNIHFLLSYAAFGIARRLGIPTVWTAHDMMSVAYTKLTHWIDPTRCGVESPAQYRLPRWYNLRQMRLRYNPMRNLIIHHMLRRQVNAWIAVSDAQRQALEVNGIPPLQVVYNGIDSATFAAPDLPVAALRNHLKLNGRHVILFAGRLTREKGSEQLFLAVQQLITRLPTVTLLLLTEQISSWQNSGYAELLTDHVCFGGWLAGAELAAAYQLADVVCAPSICMDCAPMVVLEAMAASRPTVVTCYGGATELSAENETGVVINPFDTAQFADQLYSLLTDPAQRDQMGAAGYRRVVEHFSLQHQAEQVETIYRSVIDQLDVASK